MPAKSKQQQKFMGIVRSIQKGDAPASKFSKAAQKVAKSMKKSDVKKYAKTKHDDLPKKVRENEQKLREYIRKEIIKIKESMNEVSIGDRMANRRIQQIRKYFDQQYSRIKNAVERDARTGSKEFRGTDNRGEKYKLTVVINRLKELRNKLSRKDRGLADMFTKNITPIEKVKDKMKEGMNERAWTPDQTKAVDKVDNEFNKLMAKKGIEPYSVEAARLWKSAGFDKKMGKIFGKKEGVKEAVNTQQANILMKQLGGKRFEMMMGVKSKAIGKDGLILHIGKNPKGVSHIIIDYDKGNDLYNIRFGKIRMNRYNDIKKLKGIAVDQLDNAIERNTGLYTRF